MADSASRRNPEVAIHSRNIVKLLNDGEDIVISGVGGRFPESNSMDELADNLYNNVDMITEDVNGERWPNTLYGMNHRMGRVKDIDKFDGSYFGLLSMAANVVDPQARILLETTIEAICDAGIAPQTLRGTKTGVYIGATTIGMPDGYPPELQTDSKQSFIESTFWVAGSAKSMYANRISFAFDFHGPSCVIDTACSSSLVAFDQAVTDLRLDKCDQAIVGAAQLNMQPFTNHIYQNCHFNAPDGRSKVWDSAADGFVRGETIACLLLQKRSKAKRIYATVVHTKTNIDGYKKSGNFFPSKEGQRELLEETYLEANVDPKDVNYFEAHGTGTKVGDPQEARAIADAFCKNRTEELFVGLLKSNIGHGEGASGLASVIKAIISFENQKIAANLNLKTLKDEIAEFCPPLKPVNKNTPFKPKIAGVNSFGVGGVNGHALIKASNKEVGEGAFDITTGPDGRSMPRLVNVCGRTQAAIDHLFDFIEKHPEKVTRDFLALLNDMVKMKPQLNSSGFPYRGSMMIKKVDNEKYEYKKESSLLIGKKRQVWFFFSGMGSQWPAMAKSLMSIEPFADAINRCAKVLSRYQLDLLDILLSDDPSKLDSIVNPFVAITSVQIALFDLLTSLDVHFDGLIGHSFGEVACAYADGCLTLEQAVLCSYWRGKVVQESNDLEEGVMAAVGLSWKEAMKKCPKNVFVACDNAPDSVTVSGLKNDTEQFLESLQAENIFVRKVHGYQLKAYHTPFLAPLTDKLKTILQKLIPEPKKRSAKWISTSVPEPNWPDEEAQYAGPEYFVNNFVKPVLFTSAADGHIPEDALVVEVAPHFLFKSLITRTINKAEYVGLIKRGHDDQMNQEQFLSSMGQLYQHGVNVAIERLYPKVGWPVARGTQSLSSLIKWDHSESYIVKKWPEYYFQATASDMTFRFYLDNPDEQYLRHHCIDGRIVFPATGYLMLAWRRLAASRGQQWATFPVVFDNVQFRRPVIFENGEAKITVRYLDPTGEFVILDNNNVAAFGKISAVQEEEQVLQLQYLLEEENESKDLNKNEKDKHEEQSFSLCTDDFYRELRSRGYDYGPKFQNVVEANFINLYKSTGTVRYANNTNFICFLDSMLQLSAGLLPVRALFIPVSIQSLRVDPRTLFDAVDRLKTEEITTDQEADYIHETINEYGGQRDFDRTEYDEELTQYKKEIESELREFEVQTGGGKQKWQSLLPVIVDNHLRAMVSIGVEIRGVVAVNLPRRVTSTGLRLETHEFVPDNENEAISKVFKKRIEDYVSQCNWWCLKLLRVLDVEDRRGEELIKKLERENLTGFLLTEIDNLEEDEVILKLVAKMAKLYYDESGNNIKPSLVFLVKIEDFLNKLKELLKEHSIFEDMVHLAGLNERLIRPMLDVVNENSNTKDLKVLEVNLSGTTISQAVEKFQIETFLAVINVDYLVTEGKNRPSKDEKEDKKNWLKRTVSWNESECSFPQVSSSSFDLIIHRDTLDIWHVDLNEYLSAAFDALKEKAFLMAVFRTKVTVPEETLSWFTSHGDNELRMPSEDELAKRMNEFKKAAISKGFIEIGHKSDSMLFDVLLFRKTRSDNLPTPEIIHIKAGDYNLWLEQLKEAIEKRTQKLTTNTVWLVAEDASKNGILGMVNCLRLEGGGDRIRCILDLDNKLTKIDFSQQPYKDLLQKDLLMNVLKNDKFGSLRYLTLPKGFDQTQTDQAYVNVQQRGDLSSLGWFDSRHLQHPQFITNDNRDKLEPIKCHIYYSSLNFRDVMILTGRMLPGPESAVFDCLIGSEFAGRRMDTGQRVCGITLNFGIATWIATNTHLTFEVPEHWSMEEAATITNVYMTVWYGLVERAKIRKGESILIHSASGGVGQAALTLCQYLECKIFATVGTKEKREFLKERYKLKDDQIFSSRDTDFEALILRKTEGRGVDLVLNSLAEDKLLASFRCLANDGRFVEIGKYDMMLNKPLPMFAFLKNISFHGVALDRLVLLDSPEQFELIQKFKLWLEDGIREGYVKPINRTVFNKNQVKDAVKYMMTGRHIGKVVIKIREEESNRSPSGACPSQVRMLATTRTWFQSSKVYILVGGLGGMGLEFAYWMMLRGAKKLIFVSRHGVTTDRQRLFFKQLKEISQMGELLKVETKISTQNILTPEGVDNLLSEAHTMSDKIGGVFQLAAVLEDRFLDQQTVESFAAASDPKLLGTSNLDIKTRRLKYKLDYFVCFSSACAGRGNAGQANYAYGNSAMDRICEKRQTYGHHGLAIQWGVIGDVGLMAAADDKDSIIQLAGLEWQRIPSCLHVFDKLLQCPYPVVTSLERSEQHRQSGGSHQESVMKQLWSALGIDPKTLPDHITLGELGMESFVAVELQQRLERDYDISLSLAEIKKIEIGELKEFEGGNQQKLKTYAQDIRTARANLAKIDFTIPTEPMTRLNRVVDGKPLFLLPSVEGIFDNLLPLAQALSRPVFGVNWTKDMEYLGNIKQVTDHYMKVFKQLSNDESYDLITFSFGTAVAMRMAKKKAPINKLIVIDAFSSPEITDRLVKYERDEDQNFDQLFKFLNRNVPTYFCERIKKDVLKIKNEEQRINKIIQELKDFGGRSLRGKDLDKIIRGSVKRGKMLISFRDKILGKLDSVQSTVQRKVMVASHKMFRRRVGQLVVVKSTYHVDDRRLLDEEILQSYGLSQEAIEGEYQMEVVVGGPEEVLSANLDKTVAIVSKYL